MAVAAASAGVRVSWTPDPTAINQSFSVERQRPAYGLVHSRVLKGL